MATVRDLSGNGPVAALDKPISTVVGVSRSYPITPSDSVDLITGVTTAIQVAASGAVKVTYGSGITDTVYLAAGFWHPMDVTRIWSGGTTATSIVAGY